MQGHQDIEFHPAKILAVMLIVRQARCLLFRENLLAKLNEFKSTGNIEGLEEIRRAKLAERQAKEANNKEEDPAASKQPESRSDTPESKEKPKVADEQKTAETQAGNTKTEPPK